MPAQNHLAPSSTSTALRSRALFLTFAIATTACDDLTIPAYERPPGGTDTGDPGAEGEDAPPCVVSELVRREQAVTIPADGIELEGAITLPATDSCSRFPAVVLVHGSGTASRDGITSVSTFPNAYEEIAVLADLAHALSDAGYVVLRYDKRTCTPLWGGCDNSYPDYGWDITMDHFLSDAHAALDWVKTRPEVQADQLVFMGHSQGALFAPVVLDERDDVAAAVMLAGGGFFPLHQLIGWQVSTQSELLRTAFGWSESKIESYMAPYTEGIGQLRELYEGTYSGNWILGQPTSFWETWDHYIDLAPGLADAANRPLLALSGGYDHQISTQETERWADLFGRAEDDPGHTAAVLPCITHGLNCVDEPDPAAVQPTNMGQQVDEAVIATITDFLAASLR